jgi:hypothetical protein
MKKNHEYLDEINFFVLEYPDKYPEEYAEDYERYGFPGCECWKMEQSMIAMLYERLKYFNEHFEKDTCKERFKITVSIKPAKYAIMNRRQTEEFLLKKAEEYLCPQKYVNDKKERESAHLIWLAWTQIAPCMVS